MSKLKDHLTDALAILESRAPHGVDYHMRFEEAFTMIRVALALLAHMKEPNLASVLLGVDDRIESIKVLTEKIRGEERNRIIDLLMREANRIFNKQEKNYPSNVLDVVAANLRMQIDENLIDTPMGMSHRLASDPPPEYEAEFAAVLAALDSSDTPAHPDTTKTILNARAYLEKLRAQRKKK